MEEKDEEKVPGDARKGSESHGRPAQQGLLVGHQEVSRDHPALLRHVSDGLFFVASLVDDVQKDDDVVSLPIQAKTDLRRSEVQGGKGQDIQREFHDQDVREVRQDLGKNDPERSNLQVRELRAGVGTRLSRGS